MALIVLDRQHAGKPKSNDLGATNLGLQEAILTGFYGLHCEVRLREMGHSVIGISDGFYSERHRRACLYNADAYIALHLNAGKGSYSACFYDYRSKSGKSLAGEIAKAFKVLPVSASHAYETKPEGAWPRPYECIDGVFAGKPVACLVEPLFIDNIEHVEYLQSETNIRMLGYTLAEGINNWLKQRQ